MFLDEESLFCQSAINFYIFTFCLSKEFGWHNIARLMLCPIRSKLQLFIGCQLDQILTIPMLNIPLDKCYQNRTESAGRTGSTENRTSNRLDFIILSKMYVNRFKSEELFDF